MIGLQYDIDYVQGELDKVEESFEEQNDTLTIRAYAFDSTGKIIKNSVDSSSTHYPEGLTEDAFFNAPIITKEDLAKAATP